MLLTVSYYLVPLLITIDSEALCLLMYKEKRPLIYLIQGVMNIITNLSLNFILTYVNSTNNDTLILFILEVVVFIIEGIVYSIIYKNALIGFILSFACNILSYSFGKVFINIM